MMICGLTCLVVSAKILIFVAQNSFFGAKFYWKKNNYLIKERLWILRILTIGTFSPTRR